jgi:two-component system sensor histidine kinase KdpD
MEDDDYQRPSPEALLELAKAEEQKKRGGLTIYFGAAPGVGKTYAMLLDARRLKQEGLDVVVGYVETHGRRETDALLEGLEIIPPLIVKYKGIDLREVDLTKVLERKPKLVIVDELAHTDAPGLRNTKRYQDVEEILNAGIDVFTTMNVQHLESLNDVLYQVTNMRIRETVPDSLVEKADELKLIDLPPMELLKRLCEGKVYVGDLAGHAVRDYFRPGNLLALRQLALRAVAGSVDEKMRSYMQAHAISGPWPVKQCVLAGVFASPYAEKLIRLTFRLASDLDAEWIAFYVETDRHKRLSAKEIDWLNKALDLARRLGARVVWIKGSDVTEEIATYARNNNVTKIVIGKPLRVGLRNIIPRKILARTPDIDIYLLDARTEPVIIPKKKRLYFSNTLKYASGLLAVVFMTLIAFLMRNILNEVNLLFLMLFPVILSALYLGRGPSIFAAVISILIFDYMFVLPYYTFSIHDVQYFFSFVVYIVVVVIIGNLASRLRGKMALLRQSESKSTALYGLSRDFVSVQSVEQLFSVLVRHIAQVLPCEMAIFLLANNVPEIRAKTDGFDITPKGMEAVSWVWTNNQPAGQGTDTLPKTKGTYLPMKAAGRLVGVLGFESREGEKAISPDNRLILETLADLAATALDRIEPK